MQINANNAGFAYNARQSTFGLAQSKAQYQAGVSAWTGGLFTQTDAAKKTSGISGQTIGQLLAGQPMGYNAQGNAAKAVERGAMLSVVA